MPGHCQIIRAGIRSVGEQTPLRWQAPTASGGHDVPLQDLLRRFSRSVGNLPTAMKLAERVLLFDNSSRRLQLIFSREKGRVKFRSSTMPQWVQDIL